MKDVRQMLMDIMLGRGEAQGPNVGMLEPGNIDVRNRPQTVMDDGSTATVRSMSFENNDGQEVLVPTIAPDGRVLSNREAMELYGRTGQHLGKFDNPDDATAFAKRLHEAQERYYSEAPSLQERIAQYLMRGAQ